MSGQASCSVHISGHNEKLYLVRFHPHAKDLLTSASYDMTVRIWNVQTATCHITLEGHTDTVSHITLNTYIHLFVACDVIMTSAFVILNLHCRSSVWRGVLTVRSALQFARTASCECMSRVRHQHLYRCALNSLCIFATADACIINFFICSTP